MGATADNQVHLSRRGFLGWGTALATAFVVPGATLLLGESPAAAATLSPYSLSSWLALDQQPVQAAVAGKSSLTLKVVKVTNLATATTKRMTGEVFSVGFQVARPLPAGIYTVTAPGLGSFPLFLTGHATGASALINRRLPAKG